MQSKRMLLAAVVSAMLLPATTLVVPGHAQESVAEAARKAQANKKPSSKPVEVFTNDNIDTVKGAISVVGETPAPPEDQASADEKGDKKDKSKTPAADKSKGLAKDDKTQGAAGGDKAPAAQDEAYWQQTFADARKKLASDAHELDVLQRDYNLKQQQYYSDPNVAMRQQFSRQDLTDTKTQIDDKTAAVAADKQAISDLEDDLRKAGGDPGWANPAP
jgi:hypothetical protein